MRRKPAIIVTERQRESANVDHPHNDRRPVGDIARSMAQAAAAVHRV